ncbi:hypothetical protein MBLNU457_7269t1 [Dothideomycetes sp. NU457]
MNSNTNQTPEGYRIEGVGPHKTMAGNMFDPAVNADGAMHAMKGVGGTDERTIQKEGAEHIQRTGGVGFDGQPPNVSSNAYDQGIGRTGGISSSAVHQEGIDYIRGQAGLGQSDRYGAGYEPTTVVPVTTGYPTTGYPTTGSQPERSESRDYSSRDYPSREYSGEGPGDTSTRSGLTGSNANTRDQATVGDVDNAGAQAREGTAQGGDDIADTKEEAKNEEKVAENKEEKRKDDGAKHEMADTDAKNSSGHHVGGYIGNPEMDAGTSGPPESIPMAGNERIGTKHWGESKVIKDTPLPRNEDDDATKENTEKNKKGKDDGEHKESMMDKIKDKMGMGHHEK